MIKDCSTFPGNFNVCAKVNRLIRLKNGQRRTSFGKYCYDRSLCSAEDCRRDDRDHVNGTWCKIECCDVTLCNTGATRTFSYAQKCKVSSLVLGTCSLIAFATFLFKLHNLHFLLKCDFWKADCLIYLRLMRRFRLNLENKNLI